MTTCCLDCAQDGQNFLGGDFGHRSIADFWICLVEEPAKLAKRDLGHALTPVLRDPLFGDELESVVLLDAGASGLDFLLVRRVGSAREQAPGIIAPLPRVGETDLGPGAERKGAMLFFEIAVIETPQLRAVGTNKKIERPPLSDSL
jgi:hypothetical protein